MTIGYMNDYEWLLMIINDYEGYINDYEWLLMIINDYEGLFMIIHDY